MKTRCLFVFIVFNLFFEGATAQCSFGEDYNTPTGWTQIGSEVEILNGKVHFINGAKCREFQKRLQKPLGKTLNESDCWEAKFEFTPTSVGTKNNLPYTGHVLLGLTAGTNSFHFDCHDPPCTGHNKNTQDGILIIFAAQNPPTGDLFFFINAKDSLTENRSQRINSLPLGTTHYVKVKKAQNNIITLGVFSDSSFTNHLPGSPVTLNYSGNVEGLTYAQHGNTIQGESRRQLTGTLDNLCIKWFDPIPAGSNLKLPKDTLICAGDSIVLNAGIGANFSYLWSTGDTDSIITVAEEGVYHLTVSNGCEEFFDTIDVVVTPKLFNQLEDATFCHNEKAFLSYVTSDASLLWNTGETSSTIYPTQTGLYFVAVSYQCDTIYDEAFVEFKDCQCDITLPNIFTPNNDGHNDYFKPVSISTECVINLTIFNRWGRLVFETTDVDFRWDGGDVADGVYFWIVNYTDSEGSSYPGKKGTVTIVR